MGISLDFEPNIEENEAAIQEEELKLVELPEADLTSLEDTSIKPVKTKEEEDSDDFLLEEIYDEEIDDEDDSDDLIVEFSVEYNKEEAQQYQLAVKGPVVSKKSLIYAAVIAAIGVILGIISKSFPIIVVIIVIAGMTPGFNYLIRKVEFNKYYKRTKSLWEKGKAVIRLFEKHTEIHFLNDNKTITGTYDNYYRIKEINDRIYLQANVNDILIVDKSKIPADIEEALLNLDD